MMVIENHCLTSKQSLVPRAVYTQARRVVNVPAFGLRLACFARKIGCRSEGE